MAYYLAIDIGGTNIKYGLIDEERIWLSRMKCRQKLKKVDLEF